MSKPKDVNLDEIWALVEEKETSVKLTRNDGIGDEWRGSEDDGQDKGPVDQEVDLKDQQQDLVPKPLQEDPPLRSSSNLLLALPSTKLSLNLLVTCLTHFKCCSRCSKASES